MFVFWNEFDILLIKVNDVYFGVKKIVGVWVFLFENVDFEICLYSLFNVFKWYVDGIYLFKELVYIVIECEFMLVKLGLLEYVRKKII